MSDAGTFQFPLTADIPVDGDALDAAITERLDRVNALYRMIGRANEELSALTALKSALEMIASLQGAASTSI